MLTDLQGQIERITYFNDENGYTVAKVKVYDRNALVTVVGSWFRQDTLCMLWSMT